MTEQPITSITYCSACEIDRGNITIQGVSVSTDLEQIKRSIDSECQDNDRVEEITLDTGNVDEMDVEDELALDLSHFFKSLQKYYELAYISSRIDNMFLGGYFKSVINNHVVNHFDEIEIYNGTKIYKIEDSDLPGFNRIVERWEHIKDGIASFAPAVLLSVVASFDSLFAELFKNLLLLRPERYNSSDRQLTVSSLLRLSRVRTH